MVALLFALLGIVAGACAIAWALVSVHEVPMKEPPGILKRMGFYFTNRTVETSPDARLPELRTRQYALGSDELYDVVCMACRQLDWQILRQSSETLSVEAAAANRFNIPLDQISVRCSTVDSYARVNVKSTPGTAGLSPGASLRHVMNLHDQIGQIIETTHGIQPFTGNRGPAVTQTS